MEEDRADLMAERFTMEGASGGGGGGKGKGRGGGRRGGWRGGGRGGTQSRGREISHALSRLLRHQALNAGIPLDGEGYAPLDKVLAWGPLESLGVTFDEVQREVAESDKQRFSMKPRRPQPPEEEEEEAAGATTSTDPRDWLIRANQGHSIRLDSSSHLRPITLEAGNVPPVVVHGTYLAFWPSILASGGLSRMSRNHVHCSTGLPGPAGDGGGGGGGVAVISGMRSDAELLVYIDVEASLRDGAMSWWLSDNGVVLTEGTAGAVAEGGGAVGEGGGGVAGLVPLRYFKEVVGRDRARVGTLWRDGAWVADLPAGLRVSAPRGKGRSGGGGGGGRGGKGRGGGGGGGGGDGFVG